MANSTDTFCAVFLSWDVSILAVILAQRLISILLFSLEALGSAHKLVNGQGQTDVGNGHKRNFNNLLL